MRLNFSRRRSQASTRLFVQSGEAVRIPIPRARAVGTILATNGSGTHETWALMDAWVRQEGLRPVLHAIKLLYESNGSDFITKEESWWISQLATEPSMDRGGLANGARWREIAMEQARQHLPSFEEVGRGLDSHLGWSRQHRGLPERQR